MYVTADMHGQPVSFWLFCIKVLSVEQISVVFDISRGIILLVSLFKLG